MTILKNDNAKFKEALRKYLNTHSLYSLAEFLFVEMIYNTVVKKIILFLHCKNCLYLCIYDLFQILLSSETLKDPWNVCTYVCIKISTQSIDISKKYVSTLIYVMHIKQNIRLNNFVCNLISGETHFPNMLTPFESVNINQNTQTFASFVLDQFSG